MTREDAIKIVRNIYQTDAEKEALATLIPELRESEDERIRKDIIAFLQSMNSHCNPTQDWDLRNRWLPYLEKQKEQKPAEWSEEYREEDVQTRFAFYTYKDDPSVLYLSNVFVEEASRNHGFGTRILKAAEKAAEAIGATTIRLKVNQDSPANVWYRKNGYGYMTFEDGYDWLEKNFEYMKPIKQEWSEEDEDNIDSVIDLLYVLDSYIGDDCSMSQEETEEIRNKIQKVICPWLKNLHPRPSWKPNKEQMEWLESAVKLSTDKPHIHGIIISLYEQLKRL